MAGTLLLLFISLSITTSLFNNALADEQGSLQNNQRDESISNAVITCPSVTCRKSRKAPFLIVFGDSLFDVGFGIQELCLPSNYDPYKSGRFSDGRTIPDFIAEYIFGAEQTLVNAYGCNLAKPEFEFQEKHTTLSFARAGAGVLEGINGEKDKNTGRTLDKQVELFLGLNEKFKKFFDKYSKRKEETLYLISIGAFDYLQEIIKEASTSIDPTEVVGKIVDAVQRITDEESGRRFAIMNIGPLRDYPIVQKLNLDKEKLGNLGHLVEQHNKILKEKLQETSKVSKYNYSIFDYHGIIEKIMKTPELYGFDAHTIKSACCGWGPLKAEGCGSQDLAGCGKDSIEEYLFFDGMHHTEHINHLLTRIFWNSNEFTSPKNLKSIAGLEKRQFRFPDF